MKKPSVIAVFDVGKTNKKLLLFNDDYQILLEDSISFPEIRDEDGDPCENLASLSDWIRRSLYQLAGNDEYDLRAVNFSAYGASWVHVGANGQPVCPLYNYLKPYPAKLQQEFYERYGGPEEFSRATASPVLGSLNSGLQLYRLKKENPSLFEKIRVSLHLPQYLSSLISNQHYSDISSIGCHTALWDFEKKQYHAWVNQEVIIGKLAPIVSSQRMIKVSWMGKEILVGAGLHDSTAALIPYQLQAKDPFVLLSTGTWNISLNPFNAEPLTADELAHDCLCYLDFRGRPVKASRLFAGNEHERETNRLAKHFAKALDYYKSLSFDSRLAPFPDDDRAANAELVRNPSAFAERILDEFRNYEQAYHQLMNDIIKQQKESTQWVIGERRPRIIFVDGGFSRNPIFLNLLARSFPQQEILAARIAQASALGAALAVHQDWNSKEIPTDLIEWQSYSGNL